MQLQVKNHSRRAQTSTQLQEQGFSCCYRCNPQRTMHVAVWFLHRELQSIKTVLFSAFHTFSNQWMLWMMVLRTVRSATQSVYILNVLHTNTPEALKNAVRQHSPYFRKLDPKLLSNSPETYSLGNLTLFRDPERKSSPITLNVCSMRIKALIHRLAQPSLCRKISKKTWPFIHSLKSKI